MAHVIGAAVTSPNASATRSVFSSFCFKQKTAYEIPKRDWSSDVALPIYRKLNPDSPFPVAYEVALYSLAELNKEQRAFLVQIGGISGLVLLTAVALMAWISHKFSVSIRELVAATIEIQQGNFAIKVPVRTQDEIGHLATSFNEMAVGLAQKEKFKSVLDKVADKEVAEQLMSGQLVLGGEAREVSILFCDIRGFTPLTEDMPPAEVIQMLNEHMTELTRVVYENNGVVDKFVRSEEHTSELQSRFGI